MKVVFFDLETTGTLVNKHGIHQISGMIVIDGEVKETFDFKVQPNPKGNSARGFRCGWCNQRADSILSGNGVCVRTIYGYFEQIRG